MADRANELLRRLPWLLVFRAAVATALFILTLAADLSAWPLRRMSGLLYGVVIGSYLVVLILGLLVRSSVKPGVLAGVHLSMVLLTAALVVHATGGVDSTFSFLFVLTILDAAMIGGQPLALVMASACSVSYGSQVIWQLLSAAASSEELSAQVVANTAVSHVAAFYMTAWLAGHLAELWRRAREEASTAQVDLRRSEMLYAHVMESLPVGVLTVDAEGRLVSCNAALERILAVKTQPYTRPPPVVERFLAQQIPVDGAELQLDETKRYLSLARSPLHLTSDLQPQDGATDVVVVDDVTALRQLEDSLRAREKMASLGQLSAAMAHELRNPLAAISGCVELFRADSAASPAERDKMGAIVLREIERLNTLITDFLAYARPAPPVKQPVNVALLAREVCDVLRQDGRWRGHTVRVEGPAEVVAEGDASQLRQVVWNLVKNALEASPAEGDVTMRVQGGTAGALVEVCDSGPGIPASVRSRLFEPFQTTKEQGSGLGLAIVHSIIQAHGGSVEAASNNGHGTRMRVHLPNAAKT